MNRHRNNNLRKICGCSRRTWAKCDHPWHFNFRPKGGPTYRFSLDRELGRPIRKKEEAEAARDTLCAAIRNGEYKRQADDAGPVLSLLTLRQLFTRHEEGHVDKVRPKSKDRWTVQVNSICRRDLKLPTGTMRAFGEWAVSDVTTDAIKQFQELRRAAGVVAMNRDIGALRAVFNWALREGLIEQTPFRRGHVNVIARGPEAKRSRRLHPGEADRLLAVCGDHLRAIVTAALETGCRRGELLTLQWANVRLDGPRPAIILTAAKTKTRTLREIPISSRLRAILDMRKTGADGKPHKPTAYVFGDDTGAAIGSFKRSWATAKLRAHGFTPEYIPKTAKLTAASLTQLRALDLHFHDLRREAGSRWLDAGVPLHTIQHWLGHTNIKQTSTYLAVTDTGSHDAMARFDAARDLPPIATSAGTQGNSGPQEQLSGNSGTQKTAAILH